MIGRYLRREKELAEARFEVIQAETNRLRQQVINLQKQADAAEQALTEERQKTEVWSRFWNCVTCMLSVIIFILVVFIYLIRVPSKELRERLGIDDIILILQQYRLRWYGHVLRKEDTDWMKKYMEYEVEGSTPRGRPKRTWKEVVQKDCQARNLNKEDAMDRGRLKKLI